MTLEGEFREPGFSTALGCSLFSKTFGTGRTGNVRMRPTPRLAIDLRPKAFAKPAEGNALGSTDKRHPALKGPTKSPHNPTKIDHQCQRLGCAYSAKCVGGSWFRGRCPRLRLVQPFGLRKQGSPLQSQVRASSPLCSET